LSCGSGWRGLSIVENLPLLGSDAMRFADRFTIDELGLGSLVLMEVAGRAVADAVTRRRGPRDGPVLVLAGTGNNGADALVAARHLRERGIPVQVLGLGPESKLTPDGRVQVDLFRRLGGRLSFDSGGPAVAELCRHLPHASTLVDGVFGIGLDREVRGFRADVLDRAARSAVPSVAVDLPSGLDADRGRPLGVVLPAEATVTFQFLKRGLVLEPGRTLAGQLEVADIGIPPRVLARIRPPGRTLGPPALPRRDRSGHKGTFGHLLVVAGAADRPGAALLTARAALRSGAGLVTLGTSADVLARASAELGPLMGLELGRVAVDGTAVEAALTERSGLLVGPSLPGDGRTGRWLNPLLDRSSRPVVLDAGALRALDDLARLRDRPGPTILTPHPGELGALLGVPAAEVQTDRWAAATEAAARSGAVVVLKGASTLVATPEGRVGVCLRGNPGLGTGGTGDVLSGMVAGVWVQGFDPEAAASAAVWVHGVAGDRVARSAGELGLVASDLLAAIGPVWAELETGEPTRAGVAPSAPGHAVGSGVLGGRHPLGEASRAPAAGGVRPTEDPP
jgi:NAD(P)H-hydrate epimerase